MLNFGNISELKIESKIGKLNKNDSEVYGFLSDFNNFSGLMPSDKVKNWEATTDDCSFVIDKMGKVELKIIEKEPHKVIKITSSEKAMISFTLWIQLKQMEVNDTRVKLSLKSKLNPMVKAAAKKPLQDFVDSLVDQMVVLFG